MASNLMQYFYCFVVLSVCIDRGDGRWKKRDEVEILRHDIEIFRKMAEKIEHDIEDLNEEYPEKGLLLDNMEKVQYKYIRNTLNRDSRPKDASKQDETIIQKKDTSSLGNNNIYQETVSKNTTVNKTTINNHVSFKDNTDLTGPKWLKFEDLLLEMGKKYDWKNDRWIKVKEKLKVQSNEVNVIQKDVDFHERHKFSYRIVKLNRNKRRNVVVAVSAVR